MIHIDIQCEIINGDFTQASYSRDHLLSAGQNTRIIKFDMLSDLHFVHC